MKDENGDRPTVDRTSFRSSSPTTSTCAEAGQTTWSWSRMDRLTVPSTSVPSVHGRLRRHRSNQRLGTRARFLDEFTRLSIAACTSLGFTTGIDDEDLSEEAVAAINTNANARDEVNIALDLFGKDGKKYGSDPVERLARPSRRTSADLDKGKQRLVISQRTNSTKRVQPTMRSTWPFPVPVVPWTT